MKTGEFSEWFNLSYMYIPFHLHWPEDLLLTFQGSMYDNSKVIKISKVNKQELVPYFCYLFLNLFNDTFWNVQVMQHWNEGTIVNDELGRKLSCPVSRYYTSICLQRLRNTTKGFGQTSQPLNWGSNPAPAGVPSIQLCHSLFLFQSKILWTFCDTGMITLWITKFVLD